MRVSASNFVSFIKFDKSNAHLFFMAEKILFSISGKSIFWISSADGNFLKFSAKNCEKFTTIFAFLSEMS
jgi:hypothetical protein